MIDTGCGDDPGQRCSDGVRGLPYCWSGDVMGEAWLEECFFPRSLLSGCIPSLMILRGNQRVLSVMKGIRERIAGEVRITARG